MKRENHFVLGSTIIMDDYSRAIAGYDLTSFCTIDPNLPLFCTPSGYLEKIIKTMENLWDMMITFYSDNGSDFLSYHLEQVSAEIKMRLLFSIPGKPRGRGKIELCFLTINQMLLSTLPGYIPNERISSHFF